MHPLKQEDFFSGAHIPYPPYPGSEVQRRVQWRERQHGKPDNPDFARPDAGPEEQAASVPL